MAAMKEPTLYDEDSLQLAPKQVRLLTVSTQSSDALIHCDLEVVNLDHPYSGPEYYALSYTWGAPTEYGRFAAMSDHPNRPIFCNGVKILVTENLHYFLQRLRHSPTLSGKRFWIDAICINQNRMTERSDQVKVMAHIYTSAALVVSWLGEEDEHTEPGFSILKALKHRLGDARLSPNRRDHDKELADFPHNWWISVAKVFQRTYFTRVWIIQEVVLAKAVKVLCGGHELDWSVLAETSHFFATTNWRDLLDDFSVKSVESELGPQKHISIKSRYMAPATLMSIKRECDGRKQRQYQHENRHEWARTLLYTLIRSRKFKATDRRDKIYSLLGLVHEYACDKPGLNPAYEEEEEALAMTYINAAIQILEDSDDLLVLTCVEGDKFQRKDTGSLPSWVPDWSSEESTGLRVTGYRRYSASASMKQRPTIDRQSLTLGLEGIS